MKNNMFKTVIMLLISLLVLGSCTPLYVPQKLNVPSMRKTGDASVSGSLGFYSADVKGSYAITDHVGVMLNTSIGYGNIAMKKYTIHRQLAFSTGLGYYHAFPYNFSTHVFVGGGGGNAYMYNATLFGDSEEHSSTFQNYFVQPSFFLEGDLFSIGAAVRYTYLNMAGPDYIGAYNLLEPALVAKFGVSKLKWTGQLGAPIVLDKRSQLPASYVIVGVGVEYNFGG